jgi:hypothetical protein
MCKNKILKTFFPIILNVSNKFVHILALECTIFFNVIFIVIIFIYLSIIINNNSLLKKFFKHKVIINLVLYMFYVFL